MRARIGKSASDRQASDPDLLLQVAAGQLGGLGELYDRYQAPLRSFILRVTRDAHDADDLVHATFLTAAQCASRYDGRACCRPWLIGIAAQLLRRRRRSFGRIAFLLGALERSLPRSSDPRGMLQARSDTERALAKLSEAKRITVLMAEVEGLSCEEIACALDIPIGTVWTRLHAARRELRISLSEPTFGSAE
ncbi:MAG: RNA polymerase sigma factor [Myxococcales bacterium]|nr:MAG: RNA polymerase sigma factor [Myxococcales bacterium]